MPKTVDRGRSEDPGGESIGPFRGVLVGIALSFTSLWDRR